MKKALMTMIAILAFAVAAAAQGSIEGSVTNANGETLANVTVSVIAANGKAVATAKTDAEGHYSFENIAAGTYKVSASVTAYKGAVQQNVAVEDDETATVDITLSAAAQPIQTVQGGWPQPKFRFEVEYTFEGRSHKLIAQEVSGLDVETQPIEYRTGNSPVFSVQKMPGIKKSSDITLKKGIFVGDNKLFEWYRAFNEGRVAARSSITIKLLDEDGKPTMVWNLLNAFPIKITGSAIDFESIVIAHEGLMIDNKN